MVDELSSYRNYVRGIRGLLLFAGLWPMRKLNCSAYHFMYYFNTLGCIILSCATFNFGRANSNNLELLTKSIGITGSFLSTTLKVVCFRVNYRNLADLHYTLEKYFEESIANPKIRTEVLSQLNIYSQPFYALSVLVFLTVLLILITPPIVICIQLSKDIYPLHYLLPYAAKYPWPFEGGSFLYYVHYVWQSSSGLYLFLVTSGVDSLFGYYVFQMRAIFRMMSHQLQILTHTDGNKRTIIREIVNMHQMLSKCRDQVEMIYGPIILWIFISSAVIICTLVFQATQTREQSVRHAVLFFVYITVKLVQAFMYAWYGSVVITESEEFRIAIYSCDWPGSGDKYLMNNILIMMCTRPMGFTACKFLIISTDMFTTIINTSMSYFFLLRTMDA
ncbi:odorant receptor 13a-like isoform X1 [Venturia canescens]|uniref:odorant receptor 13a-like isoform X1 n=1 Tax=Venturia canescens TaxID=32260 RepID=UPI001C9D2239|nr:odorant receptor 13a-like isoform X1 [Venturia canescens]